MAILVFALFAAHVIAWVALPDRKREERPVVPVLASAPALA